MGTQTTDDYLRRTARFLDGQSGVASRRQLAEAGIGRSQIRNQLRADRWQTEGNRVIVLHNGPLDEEQQRWAAVLGQAPGAALGGITAAQAHGLSWRSSEKLHVIVPEGSRIVPSTGVIVHPSRTYDPSVHLQPGLAVPRTRIERSIIDAAAWTESDRRACGVLCASVQQGLVTAAPLLQSLAEAGPIRRRHLIGLTLGDIEGGAQSLLEIDFTQIAARAGLPPPKRQSFRLDAQGRRRWIDTDFDFFDVEVDGFVHLLPATYWDDMNRQNEIVISGRRLLRFSTVAVRLHEDVVASQLRRAAEAFRR